MSLTKKIFIGTGIVIIAIQFIRPARNISSQVLATDIFRIISTHDSVQVIFKKACYDCHSNNTDYPLYSNIQPIGWILVQHIRDGKEALNFSEFGNYSARKQLSKLDGIANSIRDKIMPLSSYTLMHKKARLSKDEKILIFNWVEQTKDSLSAKK